MLKHVSTREIQGTLAKKVTAKMLDHELHRFTTMSQKALMTRIRRITKPVKAEAMRQMAVTVGESKLAIAARNRRDEVFCWN